MTWICHLRDSTPTGCAYSIYLPQHPAPAGLAHVAAHRLPSKWVQAKCPIEKGEGRENKIFYG